MTPEQQVDFFLDQTAAGQIAAAKRIKKYRRMKSFWALFNVVPQMICCCIHFYLLRYSHAFSCIVVAVVLACWNEFIWNRVIQSGKSSYDILHGLRGQLIRLRVCMREGEEWKDDSTGTNE